MLLTDIAYRGESHCAVLDIKIPRILCKSLGRSTQKRCFTSQV